GVTSPSWLQSAGQGMCVAPVTTSENTASISGVPASPSSLTSVAITSTDHTPLGGDSMNTFSTVSIVFATPPGTDQFPESSPLFPQYPVLAGLVTLRLKSLIRATDAAVLPGGSRYTIVARSGPPPAATVKR